MTSWGTAGINPMNFYRSISTSGFNRPIHKEGGGGSVIKAATRATRTFSREKRGRRGGPVAGEKLERPSRDPTLKKRVPGERGQSGPENGVGNRFLRGFQRSVALEKEQTIPCEFPVPH